MPGRSNQNIRLVVALAAAMLLQAQAALADNTLIVRKSSGNAISIELSNTDAIAGIQFSLNGRGGLSFLSFEGSDRALTSGLDVYQYLKDNVTLNIVILAPVRSSLAAGAGSIGTISFSFDKTGVSDSVCVFLTNVVLCNAAAQSLSVRTEELTWSIASASDAGQAPFTLEPNFPNPFNPSTTIAYRLEKPSNVRLTVYDVAGRQIKILVDEFQTGGRYSVRWNASGREGSLLASGMYFARLQVGDHVAVQKMVLAK